MGTVHPKVEFVSSGQLSLCGFCAFPVTGDIKGPEGTHSHCPSATLNGAGTKAWKCACGCMRSQQRKCFTCGRREELVGENINPLNWRCFDPEDCARYIEDRMAKDPTIQLIREIRERVVAEQAEERATKRSRRYAELGEDAPAPRIRGEARPTSGKCVHCGESTKGGKFLPGHDAAYLSELARIIAAGQETLESATSLMVSLGLSDALQAKLAKRVVG